MASGNVLINQGTQTAVAVDTVGTLNYQAVKIDVGGLGSTVPWQGTTSSNILSGTLQQLSSVGTISRGTVDSVSQLPTNSFGTIINTTSNSFGTIISAISGSQIWITDITISVGSTSNVAIYSGSTSNPLYGTFYFAPNGGIISNFRTPLFTVSGSALTYQQSTSGGPLSISVQGFVR